MKSRFHVLGGIYIHQYVNSSLRALKKMTKIGTWQIITNLKYHGTDMAIRHDCELYSIHLPSQHQSSFLIIWIITILDISAAWAGFTNPPNWNNKQVYELSSDPSNNGYINEDLIVWMRTAALPNFRKLYRKISHAGTFTEKLPKGSYRIIINYGNNMFCQSGFCK